MNTTVDPHSAAARMARLVDVMLPGDDLFPPASLTGTHGIAMTRIRERGGSDSLSHLLEMLAGIESADPETATRIVANLVETAPTLFALVRMAIYTAYYASPPVIGAIRAMGHEYNDAPQPNGYRLRTFDPAPGVDAPRTPRGEYKRTDEIVPVNTSSLAELDLPIVWRGDRS